MHILFILFGVNLLFLIKMVVCLLTARRVDRRRGTATAAGSYRRWVGGEEMRAVGVLCGRADGRASAGGYVRQEEVLTGYKSSGGYVDGQPID